MGSREQMIRTIEEEARMTRAYTGLAAFSERVMAALRAVPREAFVPPELERHAFDNGPLPIGHGQTISQPYIVALMTELLAPGADATLLEIGTGSGYQAAVLSRLAARVCTVEVVHPLAVAAAARLARLGYDNVTVREGDGRAGWPELAPFDGIIVTAAPEAVPPALVQQLRPGGRLVIPVGPRHFTQELRLYRKGEDGRVEAQEVLPVAFVPLIGS